MVKSFRNLDIYFVFFPEIKVQKTRKNRVVIGFFRFLILACNYMRFVCKFFTIESSVSTQEKKFKKFLKF